MMAPKAPPIAATDSPGAGERVPRRVLITSGPTREYIDTVRFFSNSSSGKMGYELARAAGEAGHRVTLISGPTEMPEPSGVEVVQVTSAEEMLREAERVFAELESKLMTFAKSNSRFKSILDGLPSDQTALEIQRALDGTQSLWTVLNRLRSRHCR